MESQLAKLSIADKKQAKPAAEFVSKSNGLAGAYVLDIKNGSKAYRYDVEITRQHPTDPAKNRSLTKRAPDDGEASLRKILCTEVLNTFKSKSDNFGLGPKGQFICYDGGKTLYLSQPMALQAGKKSMEFKSHDLSSFGKNQLLDCSVLIEISQSQQHEIDFSNIASMMDTREGPADRSAFQFLDVLTSQYAVTSLEYVSLGLGKLFQRSGEVMNNKTMELRSGLSKGMQLVENGGKINVALIVDAKKTAFYYSNFLHKILKDADVLGNRFQYNAQNLSQLYNGVRASIKYAQNRTVVISKICTELAKNVKVEKDSMAAYFKKKYNVEIDPMLPVVQTEKVHYPMDVLIICPNQRVPMEKLDDNIRRTILMGTAVPPGDRFARIRQEVEKAQIVPSNKIMEFFGVKLLAPKMFETINQVRAAPTVMISKHGKQDILATNMAAWKMNGVNVISPTQFLVNGFLVLHPKGFDPKQFVEGLILAAGKLGLKLGAPSYQEADLSNYKAMLQKFVALSAEKTRFVLVFDHQRSKSHHNLKLLEREYQILTMQIRIETTKRTGGMSQTYENLVLKINAKAAGINFIPMIEKCGAELSLQRKVLVVGLDVSLPTRGSPKELYELRKKDLADVSSHEPAVVGITGNFGKQPATILGDYYYQAATHEQLDPELLKQNFHRVLDRFMKSRNLWPEHIVIFRDGVGNGQLHKTTQAEYPIFEYVCKQLKGEYPMPNIIYMIVTKKHNKRFVGGSAGKESNPAPNSVINFLRPDLCEFYMQSHKPLKGTSKIPHYCVMMNPKNMSMDALQAFCNHLCCNHQVVTSAVSLPEPIYHAKEQTKRGRDNYTAKRQANNGNVPRSSNGLVDCPKVTEALGYAKSSLGGIKFAA